MAFHRGGVLLAGSILTVLVVAWWLVVPRGDSVEDLLAAARRAQRLRRLDRGLVLADRVLARSPENVAARKLAGELAYAKNDYDRAVSYLVELPDRERPEQITGMLGPGDRMDSLRTLSRLAVRLEARIDDEPTHVLANDHLAYILTVSGRRWEARRPLLNLVRRGRFTSRHLLLLGKFDEVASDLQIVAMLNACLDHDQDELLAKLGLGRIALEQRDFKTALEFLDAVVQGRPELGEARARVLLTLLEQDAIDEYPSLRSRDEHLLDHPRLWLADAGWALRTGQDRVAVRCLWEAIRREPDLRAANYQLAQLLGRLGRAGDSGEFRERARRLGQLEKTLGLIETRLDGEADVDLLQQAARQCEELGRLWEAFGWASEAIGHEPASSWAKTVLPRLKQRLATEPRPPQTLVASNPALAVDLSEFPLPSFQAGPSSPSAILPPRPVPGLVTFEDRARKAGIGFTYFNSADPATEGARMFEYTGGGVAVLDFDRDGWPDLYFTQGCSWPPTPGKPDRRHRDRLFQNRGDGTFVDVTSEAGLGDTGFSQGVAVGDIDHDGWPDLYVANIGTNRLYLNNADGTFEDVSGRLTPVESVWTTSCLVADLDGDGHTDVYDVNYLSGPGLFSTICQVEGVKMACHPNEFAAEGDRWWRGDGAGGFVEATRGGGFEVPDGKGLGIVAGCFSKPGSLEVFVANDAVANFLFVAASVSGTTVFREEALVRGLAVDRDGRVQACMGVAAGDADGDGRLDLFVTNFADQSNAFYRQGRGLMFSDTAHRAGLREPGWRMLGFGTQFVDADLDGDLDLVVANGHVDDLQRLNQPYRMRPQLFRNVGEGRFRELQSHTLGEYFERELLGRGLARGDFDRDGRDDFAVSHLEQPVGLLLNRTQESGHWLAIRLVATSTARDAIGARVTVVDGKWKRTRHLTAGDGYQASNQRQLTIGLGDRRSVELLRVDWPSGRSETLHDVGADGELVIVEGRGRGRRLPR
ncbi:MAG: hypothetical protein CMJ65_14295 [Planctomycetaceae bacterium]|nr:hypothetical protein [Planctomycetaceae bacterium]